MDEVRVGVVGAGWMGKAHASAFRNAQFIFGKPTIRIEIVADIDPRSAEILARNQGCKRWTTDWREVVTDPAVQVVDITTPNNTHYEVAMAAIAAGKHIYCEKPLSLDARESAEMAGAAERAGIITLVGFNYLKNPVQALARDLVRSGELGEILMYHGVRDQDVLANPTIPFSWRHDRRIAGSGALGDMGAHALSMSQFLVGDIEEVMGVTRTVVKERPVATGGSGYAAKAGDGGMRAVENDDIAKALIRYKSGAMGSVITSRVAMGRKGWLWYEIQGTKGAISFTQQRMNELRFYRGTDPATERGYKTIYAGPEHGCFAAFHPIPGIALGYNDLKIIEVRDLLAAIAEDRPAEPDFRFGHKISQTIDAILRSAEERRWVRIDEV